MTLCEQLFATGLKRRFDLLLSFEVVEHSNKPRETFAEMDSR